MTTTSAIKAAAVVAALVVLSLALSLTSASVRFQRVNQQNFLRTSTINQEDGANYNNLDNNNNNNNINDFSSGQHQARPQARQYACGRAMSNKRLADLLMLQQAGAANAAPARPKYRPFEIRTPRIIGGDETNPGEFPWTVSVKLNGQPICGGSLIDESWILTAAHCVVGYNPKNLTVRLGAYRIKDNTEAQTVDSALSLFVVHKQYSMPRPFSNDIALLKMSSAVEFSDFIIPICLPNEDKPATSTMTTSSTASGNQLGDITLDDFNTDFKTASSSSSSLSSSSSSSSLSSSSASSSIAEANSGGAPGDSFGPELGGIVVSTKMSDKEISRCFKQLEQNYLNSIGMGSIETGNAIDGQMDDETASINSALIHDLQSSAPLIRSGADVSWPLTSPNYDNYNEKAAIKLTSLPISNELLREIQSVGSMQSLHLGLQQGDIIAMASDLMASTGDGQPTGNAANRERVPAGPAHSAESVEQPPSGRPLAAPRQPSWMESPAEPNELTGVDYEHELAHVGGAKYSGELGIVVGWGWVRENDNDEQQQAAAVGGGGGSGSGPTNSNKGFQSVTLQKVRLPILRNGDCEAWFRSQEKKITLLPSQFCAGYNLGGKDACRGDSGGPMIIEDRTQSGRYKLIGIVSAGIGCARPSLPGLYTRVASFLPWINAQIQRIA